MGYSADRNRFTTAGAPKQMVDKQMARRDFAEYVRQRRKLLGFKSGEDLAKAVGVSQQTVDKWERAVSVPGSVDVLADLARALQISQSVLSNLLRTSLPSIESAQNAYETVMAQDPYLLPEFADIIRDVLKVNAKYYAMRQSQETAQVAETKSEYYPTVIAAAGTAGDLALPENQRILQEIEAEEEAEAKDIAAEEAKRKKRPRPQPKPKE